LGSLLHDSTVSIPRGARIGSFSAFFKDVSDLRSLHNFAAW
jgi:hypothetical protein